MKVAIVSKTPLAASPWELYKALRKYTDIHVNFVSGKNRYNDGRTFPYHLLLTSKNGVCREVLRESEIWHFHNYLLPELMLLRRRQKIIAQFHSLPRLGNWRNLISVADRCYTINQPLQEKEYGLKGLPNIIDPDEYYPIRRPRKIRIAFAPSSRAPIGHPACKGYHRVKEILYDLATERDVEIVWIEGMNYEKNLELKQSSHILIDDVVTRNWHRTSLEGACFGCAVLNRVNKVPFVLTSLETLRKKLLWLIDSPAALRAVQEKSRIWVLQKWHAMDCVKKYVKAYQEVLR